MKYVIVGLGNPGNEYVDTRHNIGRGAVEDFRVYAHFPAWEMDKKRNALVSEQKIGKHTVTLVLPETFMNLSGKAVRKFIGSTKAAERCLIVYDDLDLGIGQLKVSFGKGTGGHNGLESIAKSLQTKKFARLRIGISKMSKDGEVHRVLGGESRVEDYVLGKISQMEEKVFCSVMQTTNRVIETYITEGLQKVMNTFN
jgi:PTH1 family peptidyl-tRNA hydrolase